MSYDPLDIPTHREIVDGNGAYFCDPLDEVSIGVMLRRAMDQASEASSRAARAYCRISEYSMEDFLTQYERIYSCAVGAPDNPMSPPSPAIPTEPNPRFKR